MTENEIAKEIVDAAYNVHVALGPGLLESVYGTVMAYELNKRGLQIEREKTLEVFYDGIRFEQGFRIDLLVNDKVIMELKSVERLLPVHYKQTLTYAKLADKRLALLINFGESLIKDGIHRIANNLPE